MSVCSVLQARYSFTILPSGNKYHIVVSKSDTDGHTQDTNQGNDMRNILDELELSNNPILWSTSTSEAGACGEKLTKMSRVIYMTLKEVSIGRNLVWYGIPLSYLWPLQTWKQNTEKLQTVLTAMKRNYISSEFLTKQKKIHVNFTIIPAGRSFSML